MRAREFVREDADGQQVLDYIHDTHHEPLTRKLQQAVLSYPRWELRSVPLNSLHIPDQEHDDEEQEPEADPYNRVQAIDPDHAGEYSANFVDRRPIVVDAEGWIIDGNHRAWAAAELLNRPTIRAWVPVGQLNELGNAPAEYKPNRKRSRSLFHATVDGQWVDVFFDRSEFNDTLHITFAVNNNYDTPSQPTSASRSTVKILSTVLNIVKQKLPEYMAKARPPAVSFTAKGDNRTSLYRKYFVPVIQNILGPKWQHEEYPSMGMTVFHWKPVRKQDVAENFTNDKVRGTELKNSIPTGLYFDIDDVSINQSYRGSGIGALLYKLVITCIDRLNPKVKGLLSPRKNRLSTAANVSKIYGQLGGKVGINGAKDTYDLLPIKNYIKLEVEPQPGAQIAAISEKNISFLVDEAGPYRVVLTVFDHNTMKPIGFISATASFWDSETETLDNENISENFADGKNPQDKGDSKRYGVPTKASVSTLRKVAKQGGRKGQLAHWMANMKAGRAKARKK